MIKIENTSSHDDYSSDDVANKIIRCYNSVLKQSQYNNIKLDVSKLVHIFCLTYVDKYKNMSEIEKNNYELEVLGIVLKYVEDANQCDDSERVILNELINDSNTWRIVDKEYKNSWGEDNFRDSMRDVEYLRKSRVISDIIIESLTIVKEFISKTTEGLADDSTDAMDVLSEYLPLRLKFDLGKNYLPYECIIEKNSKTIIGRCIGVLGDSDEHISDHF